MLGITSSIPYSATFSDYSSGTSYVIEELRIVCVVTRNTIRQIGQLMLIKGLHENVFGYRDIPEASNVDNIRAFYNLYPGTASPTFSTTRFSSIVLDEPESDSTHNCYVLDRGTFSAFISEAPTVNTEFGISKFNLRTPLNFVSGTAAGMSYSQPFVSTNAFVGRTNMLNSLANFAFGTWPTYWQGPGIMSLGTPNHGPTKGQKTLFITTTTRILAVPTAHVDNGFDFLRNGVGASTTYQAHRGLGQGTPVQNWVTTNYTYATMVSSFNHVQYIPSIDSLLCSYYGGGAQSLPMTIDKFNEPSSRMFFQFIRFRSAFSNVKAGEYYSSNRDYHHFCVVNGIMHIITAYGWATGRPITSTR